MELGSSERTASEGFLQLESALSHFTRKA